ncbi:MAG: DNA polymerase III subunit beta [Candidatus Parcubacteria bacterium]|nr:DNA polymerase III subunit beta [Candidatus Parcubacteria bacterium]
MKITCTQENLSQGLNIVTHIASKNTSLPILNNVLIKAEKGVVNLITTNLEMGIVCQVRAKIEKDGSYTVGSKLLNDYINLLTNEKVELELKDDFFEIKSSKQETKIKGNSAEEFPLIPQVEKNNPYACQISDLLMALTQVLFAVSVSETRPEISGIYLNFNNGILTLAATDSYRLAEKKIKLMEKNSIEKEVIIPARTIQELFRILSGLSDRAEIEDNGTKENNKINIYFEDNQILFVFDNVELVSRIIEGQYPNYRQIIPSEHKTRAIINITDFIKAVKSAALFSRTGIYDISLDFKKGELKITSANNQLGESKTELEGNIEGENNKIVLNYRYLLDGLQNLDSTEVILEMMDGNNPCILRPVESLSENKEAIADVNYLYIVMPIKQ